jgi:hypothetical protein
MLSELKAWVNKKAGGLRTPFQIGNLAVVFRIWRGSGRLLSRCQLKALHSRIEREKGRALAFCGGEACVLYSLCIHR